MGSLVQTVDTLTMAYMDNLDYDEKFEVKIEKYDCFIGSDFSEVTDRENDIILDAFALLGGNENLVSQILDRLQDGCFSSVEEDVVKSLLGSLWCSGEGDISQVSLLGQLAALYQDRIHRLLSRGLLYSGRYPDTRVYCSALHPSYHVLLISMAHLVGSDLPIGQTYSGQPCYRLAILFHWASSSTNNKWEEEVMSSSSRSRRVRTFSTSLELEIKMLNITDMFAILP